MALPTSDNLNFNIDDTRRSQILDNWSVTSQEIVLAFAAVAIPAGYQFPLSISSGGTVRSRVETVFTNILIASEEEDSPSVKAYRAATTPFLDNSGFGLFRTSWIGGGGVGGPLQPTNNTDFFVKASSFVYHNARFLEPRRISRSANFIGAADLRELGRVASRTYYSIRYIREQYFNNTSGVRKVNSNGIPTTGTFGLVAFTENPGVPFLNSIDDLSVAGWTAVPSQPFLNKAGEDIFFPVVREFFRSQMIAEGSSAYRGMTVRVTMNLGSNWEANNVVGAPVFIPSVSYSAWVNFTRLNTTTNLRIVKNRATFVPSSQIVGSNNLLLPPAQSPSLPVPSFATPNNLITPGNLVTSNSASTGTSFLLPQDGQNSSTISGSAIALIIVSVIFAIIGIIALVALVIMISRQGGVARKPRLV